MDVVLIVLGSAGVGALISALINGWFTWLGKRAELERLDMQMAMKLTELRHRQVEMTFKIEPNTEMQAWDDPLVMAIVYRRGIKEFQDTGQWQAGESRHTKSKGAK